MKKAVLLFTCAFAATAAIWFSACNNADMDDGILKDSASINAGKILFTEKCAGCHNFLQDGIGPHLAGVADERDLKWLKTFIKDPKAMVDSRDSVSIHLLREFKTIMPSFGDLPEKQLDELIAYIHTFKKTELHLAAEDTNFISDPITDTIRLSDVRAEIVPYLTVPASSEQKPKTRIIKMDYMPGTGESFILDLRGKMYRIQQPADSTIDNQTSSNGHAQTMLYMDMKQLRPKFINQPGLATGFGSFAFHPDFQKNGLLYTTHTEAPKSGKADYHYHDSIPVEVQWVLTEWKVKSPKNQIFSGEGRELLRINMPSGIHGVQEIAFNRTAKRADDDYGLLYIGIGDGGSTEIRQFFVTDKPRAVWGSILRIDPAGKNSSNGKYGIPASNPFVQEKNAVKEIYAWGFRNPHKINWSNDGRMFAVNVGELNIESLNLVEAGHFYGWPIREGTFLIEFAKDKRKVHPLPQNDSAYRITYPVAQFDHDEGTAICGGYEYSGKDIPALKGKYVFGDMASGRLFYVEMDDIRQGHQSVIREWTITMNGKKVTLPERSNTSRADMRFGMDSRGELYIFTKQDGVVYRLVSSER